VGQIESKPGSTPMFTFIATLFDLVYLRVHPTPCLPDPKSFIWDICRVNPRQAGCREELLDPSDLGSTTAAAYSMFRGWMFRGLRVFPAEGIYRRKGDVRGSLGGPHHRVARPGVDPRHHLVWPPPGSSPSLLWTPPSCQQNRNFAFRFVQLQEYFLYNFSEIQKQQKIGTGTVAS
jgi:hypothetical protein